ncbi:MAG TPA: 4Fe-4S dicluster domain-containing protein [Verrucomicrobiae bacterium]|nr:4Fe-4S dicluster domain-containing protein [Verrucomicrobiae bacterium]
MLIDTSRCIGCRSCQVACKQWNRKGADATAAKGSFENPPQLTPNLYNRVRFIETATAGGVSWRFASERCMHCGDAGCMKVCPAPGALYRTKEGMVAWDREKCISCKYCVSACPFGIPRYDSDDRVAKCNGCASRVSTGMSPACAKACPTEAIRFGNREELVAGAAKAKKSLYGVGDLSGLGVVYALEGKPEEYGLPQKPSIPLSIFLWKDVLRPAGIIGFWGSVAAVVLHYVTIGPKRAEEVGNGGDHE